MTSQQTAACVVMPDIQFTPLQRAELEIDALNQRPDLMPDCMIGGKTPPDMAAENNRRKEERARLTREIIKKYGVIDEYLAPLQAEAQRVSERLTGLQSEIAALEKLR